jgi:hypothetical protein
MLRGKSLQSHAHSADEDTNLNFARPSKAALLARPASRRSGGRQNHSSAGRQPAALLAIIKPAAGRRPAGRSSPGVPVVVERVHVPRAPLELRGRHGRGRQLPIGL